MLKRLLSIACIALISSFLIVQPVSAATTKMYCENCSYVTDWEVQTYTYIYNNYFYCSNCNTEKMSKIIVDGTYYDCKCGNHRSSKESILAQCSCGNITVVW